MNSRIPYMRGGHTSVALGCVLLLGACAPEPSAGPWPEFRGPTGMGLSTDTNLPVSWSDGSPAILWKTEIPGRGNSTPIVSGGRVFVTTAIPEAKSEPPRNHSRMVYGLDFESGEILWTTDLLYGPKEKTHRLNTVATATPATDGEKLFVYFGSTLAALDFDGEVVWKHEIDPAYALYSRYGAASSPVLTQDAVIVLQDRESNGDVGWLAAFSKEDGSELWRVEWDGICCTYSTPLVVDRGSGEEILVAMSLVVKSFDAATGNELWEADYVIHQLVQGPVVEGDLMIVAGGAHSVRSVNGFRLTGSGKETRVEELWTGLGVVPETSSPVLYNDLFFTVSGKGILVCRDPQTGEILWKRRLQQRSNHPSLVAGDGKIYIASGDGTTSVVAAKPQFELLSTNHLEGDNGKAIASPAIADGTIVLRSERYLYRIGPDG